MKNALREAQNLGYAERNPEADVEGYDTCRKIAILNSQKRWIIRISTQKELQRSQMLILNMRRNAYGRFHKAVLAPQPHQRRKGKCLCGSGNDKQQSSSIWSKRRI